MKTISTIKLSLVLPLVLLGCNAKDNTTKISNVDTILQKELPEPIVPQTITYYNAEPGKSLVVADPVIYNVITKNFNPDDDWNEKCFERTNNLALANAVFQAVYKGKLQAIDIVSEQPMTIADVKKLEKTYSRNQMSNIQFEENWYYDENKCAMYKQVKSITLGYELYNDQGELRGFKAAFKVDLNTDSKENTATK